MNAFVWFNENASIRRSRASWLSSIRSTSLHLSEERRNKYVALQRSLNKLEQPIALHHLTKSVHIWLSDSWLAI
ncbi:MAG: hypothetical protein KKH33_01235 [Alphaproteobacteria bacterium]|nr:hypothetical protein [Alphaproteobacteria bacterium]